MSASDRPVSPFDDDASLASRAAWLHYAGGLTQGEIASRLNIPAIKAHRLIARAGREGLIRIFVDGAVADCVKFEEVLKERFQLDMVQVAPDLGEPGLPLKALAFSGANYLHAVLQRTPGQIVGIGHGRTLAAVVRHLPTMPTSEVKFVSLLGGLTRKFSASPFDVIHLIAERTDSEAYLMPVPLYANSAADRAVLLAQLGVSAVFDLARQADLMLVGIGEARPSGSLVQTGMIRPDEVAELERAGVAGEMLGHFFDAGGNIVETELSGRSISLSPQDLRGRYIVAIAGGPSKVAGIRAALASGLLKGLITDELTARRLVDERSAVVPDKKNGKGRRVQMQKKARGVKHDRQN
ncbi:sugar-binding transcriptional regulator [Bradyrhizobium sp. STM 3557]|uniref:sugar-binding transcriptional regulator n=1 Tax=Bradyrhizobium sp. STM 3557 TaxID=578920 RepID=UPI00388E04C6